jgi:hypothetical protein
MQKRIVFGLVVAFATILGNHQPALAESPRNFQFVTLDGPLPLELGAQFSMIRFAGLNTTDAAVGGRFTYNLTWNLSVEGEVNFFPQERTSLAGGRKVEALFGAKYGRSFHNKFGVFGKVRPGFIHFNPIEKGCPPGLVCILMLNPVDQTNLAVDLGGVFEIYPQPGRTAVRFDIGDTIIRHAATAPYATKHNVQFSVGVGYRFVGWFK